MKLVKDAGTKGTDRQRTDGTGDRTGLDTLAEQRGITIDVLAAAGIQLDAGGGQHDGWWRLASPSSRTQGWSGYDTASRQRNAYSADTGVWR